MKLPANVGFLHFFKAKILNKLLLATWLNRTLKTKVLLVVMAAVLITTAVTVSVSLYIMKRNIRALIGDQQYAVLNMIAVALDESFNSRRVALHGMAQGLPASALHDNAQLQQYLSEHSILSNVFSNVLVVAADGELVANHASTAMVGKINFADRQYMRRTLQLRQGIISEPFRSQISGLAVVVMTEPVFDATGKVVLVLVGSINLHEANFLNHYSTLKVGKSGFVFILTSRGIVVDLPDRSRILQPVDQAGGRSETTERALAGFQGSTEGWLRNGQPGLFSYKRIQSTDWIIGSVYLQDEAFAPVRDIQRRAILMSLVLALVAGTLAWIIMSRLMNPLHRLHRHIQKIRTGKIYEEVPQHYRQDEIGDLGNAFNALMRERCDAAMELDQARVNLERLNKTLERLALEDDLTGLANRRRFDLALQEEFGRAMRGGFSLALIMIDVDYFKQYNDIYGHQAGDQCLRKVGRAIKSQQTRMGDLMARYGGEEVAILLPGSDQPGALAVAERVLVAVRQLNLKHEGNPTRIVTISAGVAALIPLRDVDPADELLRLADRALYLAKQQGRDRVCCSSELPPN